MAKEPGKSREATATMFLDVFESAIIPLILRSTFSGFKLGHELLSKAICFKRKISGKQQMHFPVPPNPNGWAGGGVDPDPGPEILQRRVYLGVFHFFFPGWKFDALFCFFL